jgi:predicted  nucleic acid-binding Zn-ribbon protein
MKDYVADMRQRLERLNQLEEQLVDSRKWRDDCPSDEAVIESLRAEISPSMLVHHDRLRARGRKSIAEVRNGVCSGCHMGLPIGTVAAVKHQSTLLKCENCGRFIFLAGDGIAAAPQPAQKPAATKRPFKKLNEVR